MTHPSGKTMLAEATPKTLERIAQNFERIAEQIDAEGDLTAFDTREELRSREASYLTAAALLRAVAKCDTGNCTPMFARIVWGEDGSVIDRDLWRFSFSEETYQTLPAALAALLPEPEGGTDGQ
jgi:uncharacterized membrane protein